MSLFLVAARLVGTLNRFRIRALVAVGLTTMFLGAAAFSIADHVSFGTGLYWAITTATTVGYGDVTPHNTASRIVAAAVMLTTIPIVGAIFALGSGAAAVTRLRRILGMDNHLPDRPYTLVFGSHPVVSRVLDELVRTGDQAVLIAPQKPSALDQRVHFMAGEPTDESIIRKSDLSRANRAAIACNDDSDTLVVAVAIHTLAPDLEVLALTHSQSVARALHELGVSQTLSSEELVGHTLAKSLETPQAGGLLLSLVDSTRYQLKQLPVEPELVSQPLSRARATSDRLVLGIARDEHVDLGVGQDPVLDAGDHLVVLEPL
jgi:voltage-gated potassium channel